MPLEWQEEYDRKNGAARRSSHIARNKLAATCEYTIDICMSHAQVRAMTLSDEIRAALNRRTPKTFRERMLLQMEVVQQIAAARGWAELEAVDHLAEPFADEVPNSF